MAATIEAITQLKFEPLTHPQYSAHQAPSDYYMFGPQKEVLYGQRYASGDEV